MTLVGNSGGDAAGVVGAEPLRSAAGQASGTPDKLIIGLTGGIGSGKSTVAALFDWHGAGVIDTDVISHNLTRPGGGAMAEIRANFGNDFLTEDGALDRTKMRGLIFSDAHAKQRLEQILHPLIFGQARLELQQLSGKPYILVVVPLLAESSTFIHLVHRILVVDCDENTQVERVMRRSCMSEGEVRSIIMQQTSRARRLLLANHVISNDADMDSLAHQVNALHEYFTKTPNIN